MLGTIVVRVGTLFWQQEPGRDGIAIEARSLFALSNSGHSICKLFFKVEVMFLDSFRFHLLRSQQGHIYYKKKLSTVARFAEML